MSRNNEATDPSLALAINPLNSEAAVNQVVGSLNAEAEPDLDELAATARRMIAAAPADARGYSILGAIQERAGHPDTAQSLYAIALRHSKSELHALLRTAQLRLDADDTPAALENIDLLLRRWPGYWKDVQPVLNAIALDPGTGKLLAAKLNELPPWRGQAIAAFGKEPGTLGVLRDLIAGAPPQVRERPGWIAERDTAVGALVSQGAYVEAHSLFLSTLTPAEAAASGYVFDGGFSLPLGHGFFGWRVQKPGATEIRTGAAEAGNPGLRIRFLDSPARPGIVTQNLLLPFGRYRLAVSASGSALRTPRDLFWSVRCGKGPALARLPVPDGGFANSVLEVEFEVPPSDCQWQTLSLDTAVRTESWRDRYQGEVRFSGLAITRL